MLANKSEIQVTDDSVLIKNENSLDKDIRVIQHFNVDMALKEGRANHTNEQIKLKPCRRHHFLTGYAFKKHFK